MRVAPGARAVTDDGDDAPTLAAAAPVPAPAPAPPRARAATPARRDPAAPALQMPMVGSGLLARSTPSRLPWMLVGALVVAVAVLVAYIVMK